jgi:hypothetical protein
MVGEVEWWPAAYYTDLNASILPFPNKSADINGWVTSINKSDIVMAGFHDYSSDKYKHYN